MLDGILHNRLQHHAGNNHVQSLWIEIFDDPQLLCAESRDFDIEIVVDELHFLT